MAKERASNPAAWLSSVLLAVGATGCVLGLEAPVAGAKLDRPEAREETPPPRPKDCAAECRWSPGYWHWDGGGYVWVDGRWERGPKTMAESAR